MDRRIFIGGLVGAAVMGIITKNKTTRMPTLFIGHGSPMNAIANNSYTQFLGKSPELFPTPKAILVVSAHWETRGTKVLKIAHPETIHDFGGFPQELFNVQYPAPGSLDIADRVVNLGALNEIEASSSWGLDHGTWSVLKHMFPLANVPVLQLSLNQNLTFEEHLKVAGELKALRDEGVLILGSGNITHNLRRVVWQGNAPALDWATEFDLMIKKALVEKNDYLLLGKDPALKSLWQTAHPSLEHYLPLLYAYGASDKSEDAKFIFEGMHMGSLSMRSVMFG